MGTGGAFLVDMVNSAIVVSMDQGNVLVDCGHSVFPFLVKTGIIKEIDAVLVTHFHDDHVGSLSSLVLYHQIILQKGKMTLLTPNQEFEEMLKGFLSHSLNDATERVNFQPVDTWPSITPIDTIGAHVPGMQTWAYLFSENDQSIAYSGDIGNPKPFFTALESIAPPNLTIFHEVGFYQHVKAHTYYKELETYLDRYEIYGYHCDHRQKPADLVLPLVAESGFLVE